MIKAADQSEFIGQIIDLFEDFLYQRGIRIDNKSYEVASDESIIYGVYYEYLANELRRTLRNWGII